MASGTLPSVLAGTSALALDHEAREVLQRHMKALSLAAWQPVFSAGQPVRNFLILKEGGIRVSVTTASGREIVLYRVEPGQTCVLTTAGLLAGTVYEADAVADQDSEAVVLPKPVFDQLMADSAAFRQFVFSSYGGRLHSLIALVQDITTRHLDRKLAQLILRLARDSQLRMTHQAIATELNTSREVVTRILNDFEQRGWLKLSRGRIDLRNSAGLQALAGITGEV